MQLTGEAQQPSQRIAWRQPSCRARVEGTQGQGQPVEACPHSPGSTIINQQGPGTCPLRGRHVAGCAAFGGRHRRSTQDKARGIPQGLHGQRTECSSCSASTQQPCTDRTRGSPFRKRGCDGGSTGASRRRQQPCQRTGAALLLCCTLFHMAVAVAALRHGGIHARGLGDGGGAAAGAAGCVPPKEMEPSAQFHLGCQRYRKVRRAQHRLHRTVHECC